MVKKTTEYKNVIGDINFSVNIDENGEEYINILQRTFAEMTLTLDGQNKVYNGFPKIVIRNNNKKYGTQVLFQFLIKQKLSEYKANTPYNTAEYYMTPKQAKDFLKTALAFIENFTNDDKNENK